MATVRVSVECSVGELEDFLRLIRKWDNARQEVRVLMTVDAPEISAIDCAEMMRRLDPPVPLVDIINLNDNTKH